VLPPSLEASCSISNFLSPKGCRPMLEANSGEAGVSATVGRWGMGSSD
jgi:hypothetical protein